MTNPYSQITYNYAIVSIIAFCIIDFFVSLLFSSFSIFLCGALGTFLVFLLRPVLDRKTVRYLLLIKFFTVLSVLLTYYNCESLFGHPYYIGGSDDMKSESDAIRIVINF